MKKLVLLSVLIALLGVSCDNEDKSLTDNQIQFAFTDLSPAAGNRSGRAADSEDPKSVLVTIEGINGDVIADKKELTLYKFGDNFLSAPLTLKVANGAYRLTEFFVVGEDNAIVFVTPKEGSVMAHLVVNPLAIDFSIEKDKITTVTPEVIAVDDESDAGDFGYGQFGFKPIKTFRTVFSSFIKGATNFELTDSYIKIQGINDTTATDTTSLWTYHTKLEAKANTLVLREASYYRVTASKEGYAPWKRNLKLSQGSKTEILFDADFSAGDIYIAGYEILGFNNRLALYWKNGQPVKLSAINSQANDIYVSGNDVYVAGGGNGTKNAFYWKNGEQVLIPFNNSDSDYANEIFVSGNDVYVTGASFPNYTLPCYWKNGVRVMLDDSGNFTRADVSAIAVDGNDVYALGTEGILGTTNKEPSYPRIWKNSVLTSLSLPSAEYKRTFTRAIVVKNGHVYVCGITLDPNTSTYKVILWKDNVFTILDSPNDGFVTAMHVEDNGTIHIVGHSYGSSISDQRPFYWKNGVVTTVEPQADYSTRYYGVTTSGSGVVISGTHGERAVYWKGGKRVLLHSNKSFAGSIFFVKK